MVKKAHQIINRPLIGWWVGLGACGQNKMCCKRWLVCRVAALFILRSVGILSVVLLFVCCQLCRLLGLQLTLSGLAEKAMMMRFNCQLATNVRKRAELQTCFSPAFYAKPVLKAVATKRSVLHTKLEFACQVAFCVCKNQCHFSLRIVVTSKH